MNSVRVKVDVALATTVVAAGLWLTGGTGNAGTVPVPSSTTLIGEPDGGCWDGGPVEGCQPPTTEVNAPPQAPQQAVVAVLPSTR